MITYPLWFLVTCPTHGSKRLKLHASLMLRCWELACDERVTTEPWPEETGEESEEARP